MTHTSALVKAAQALVQYETSGTCDLGKVCGLCDCGLEASQLAEDTARQLDRAKHTLTAALDRDDIAKTLFIHDSQQPNTTWAGQVWDKTGLKAPVKIHYLMLADSVIELLIGKPQS